MRLEIFDFASRTHPDMSEANYRDCLNNQRILQLEIFDFVSRTHPNVNEANYRDYLYLKQNIQPHLLSSSFYCRELLHPIAFITILLYLLRELK